MGETTPGPWVLAPESTRIIVGVRPLTDEERAEGFHAAYNYVAKVNDPRDAYLIAAAPQLRDALEELVKYASLYFDMSESTDFGRTRQGLREAITNARTILEKVRGGT